MNAKLVSLILILILIGCKEKQPSSVFNSDLVQVYTTTKHQDSCIFDQKTQTDKFLKGIKALEGYSWNPVTKNATLLLSKNEHLEIFRGGCDHFSLRASFILDNQNIYFPNDEKLIIEKISWITGLLEEFPKDLILEELNNNNIELYNDHNNTTVTFKNEYLVDNEYSIWVSDHGSYSEISIGFTLY